MRRNIREIRTVDLLLYFLLPLAVLAALIVATVLTCIYVKELHPAVAVAVCAIACYFPTKYFAIGCVLVYKAFAPMSVRERCRFDPCCSTYMIMAIQKYGLFLGIIKGIRRITRCKPPNGGRDLP